MTRRLARDDMARRVAQDIPDGSYVNLGIGLPTLVANHVPEGREVIYHSDSLYSAMTHAMSALGWLEEWLDATARATGEPAVRFSSLFPFVGKTRLVSPPKTLWPPGNVGKLYLQAAKLVPLDVVKSGVVEESRWQVVTAAVNRVLRTV